MAHRLRADAKYFGACYTTAPAATLLLKLALEPEHWNVDWAMPASIRAVRIADLACGSGVLLQAALQTVLDNHVRAAGAQGRRPDLALVHRCLVEHVLFGLDVVPSAIHRAALALGAHQAEVNFPAMQLYTFPIGGRRHPKLGSLEFLFGRQSAVQADLLGGITGPERTTGAGTAIESLEIPRLELCVMNPPFTRSVGGNLLFGHLPKTERSKLQASLKDVVKRHQVRANITAGLGSVFAALGHQLVKPGGHLALVLPRALLSGVAWEDTRKLIGDFYAVRYIVVSHEPGAWNFSENTSLSECLVIAQRLPARVEDIPVKVVNLWRKPRASVEALAYAAAIRVADAPPLVGSIATRELKIGSSKIGEIVQASAARIARGCWNDGVAFAQTELSRTALYLTDGQLYVPSAGVVARVPVRPFGQLGTFGPDVRDVFDGFERTTTVTPYRAVWGHETGAVANMAQAPNAYLHPLVRARRGRPLRDAALLWSRAGRLLIAERFRLNTVRVLSVRSEHRVLSNTWWPFTLKRRAGSKPTSEQIEKALALWLNSTLGLLLIIAARVETEGAWMKFKKPVLNATLALDPTELGAREIAGLARVFDDLRHEKLGPIRAIATDSARHRIDDAILRACRCNSELGVIRDMLAREPLLAGVPLE